MDRNNCKGVLFNMFAGSLAASGLMLALAPSAQASLVNLEVPTNAYITLGSLDWAWASPVAADGSFGVGGVDFSFQGAFGWRLPTTDELTAAPSALDFIFAGANVPLGGSDPVSGAYFEATSAALNGDAALASPYFTDLLVGDWCNAPGSGCDDSLFLAVWWGQPGAEVFSDSLVVRDAAVPLPPALPLFAGGLGLMGWLARRKRKAQLSA